MKQSAVKAVSQGVNTRHPLHEHEWKFDGVPKDQLEACYLCEYAREFFKVSTPLQKLRKKWEKYNMKGSSKAFGVWRQADDLLSTICTYFPHVFFDFFPTVAWQDLPKDGEAQDQNSHDWPTRELLAEYVNDGSTRIRKSPFDRLYIVTLRQLEPMNRRPVDFLELLTGPIRREELSETFALAASKFINWNNYRPPSKQSEYGLFSINWGYSNPEIIRAFKEWLESQRREREKLGFGGSKAVVNRGGFTDKLHWLGALRVKNHYRYKELVDHADTNLKVDAPYSHYPDLLEAAKRATQEISKMFPMNWTEAEWKREKHEQEESRLKYGHLFDAACERLREREEQGKAVRD